MQHCNVEDDVCGADVSAGVGAGVGAGVLIGAKVEKLQPISVAGNPVGQCLSCKLLKIHPQSQMHPGLEAPEDNAKS